MRKLGIFFVVHVLWPQNNSTLFMAQWYAENKKRTSCRLHDELEARGQARGVQFFNWLSSIKIFFLPLLLFLLNFRYWGQYWCLNQHIPSQHVFNLKHIAMIFLLVLFEIVIGHCCCNGIKDMVGVCFTKQVTMTNHRSYLLYLQGSENYLRDRYCIILNAKAEAFQHSTAIHHGIDWLNSSTLHIMLLLPENKEQRTRICVSKNPVLKTVVVVFLLIHWKCKILYCCFFSWQSHCGKSISR